MATTTTNLGLRKPSTSDYMSVADDISGNMDILDGAIGAVPSGLNLQGQIDGMSGTLVDLVIVEEYTCTLASAVAANSYVAITASDFGISAKDGYTLVGIIGYESGSYNLVPYRFYPRTSGNVVGVRNVSSSATSTGIVVAIKGLWIRNGVL